MSRPARPELVALLGDVKENPDDLTPWLVLTDWLEENGGEADRARAEYCRLCFDKLGKKTYASDWERGERRRELFREYRERWFGPLAEWFTARSEYDFRSVPPCTGCHCQRFQVRRGLIQATAFHRELLEILKPGWPGEIGAWVERLEVRGLTVEELIDLAQSPVLEGPAVVEVDLYTDSPSEKFLQEALLALAQSPHLNGVRELCLSTRGDLVVKGAATPLKERFGPVFRMK